MSQQVIGFSKKTNQEVIDLSNNLALVKNEVNGTIKAKFNLLVEKLFEGLTFENITKEELLLNPSFTINVNVGETIQYIRIQNRTGVTEFIQIVEIEAYNANNENVALNKPTTSSEILDENRPPSEINDGSYADDSEFVSAFIANPFVEIDLESEIPITRLTIYLRQQYDHRLLEHELVLLNAQREIVFTHPFTEETPIHQITL